MSLLTLEWYATRKLSTVGDKSRLHSLTESGVRRSVQPRPRSEDKFKETQLYSEILTSSSRVARKPNFFCALGHPRSRQHVRGAPYWAKISRVNVFPITFGHG